MAISSQHPLYVKKLPDWELMHDCYEGERTIKYAGTKYLPATPGQIIDGLESGQIGNKNYQSYKERARFPDFVPAAIEALVGIMHHKPPKIELPDKMKPLLEKATVKGESLAMLLRRINEQQLLMGRSGILADIKNDSPVGTLPYIAMYNTRDIVNWDDGSREGLVLQKLNLVVLNESEYERETDFEWKYVEKYRVLVLGSVSENETTGGYRMGVFSQNSTGGFNFDESALITPSIAGNNLDQIPFVIINSKDIVPDPDDPPLLGLAQLSLTVYRGEADYRQNLFMQGQDTLVVVGATDDAIRAGAGAVINVAVGGDAKYIGVQSQGLAEQRQAIDNDKREAMEAGGRLVDTRSRSAESGDALKIRVSARTSSLNQIALAGAEGLQELLRIMAVWMGEDPKKVIVEPNTDFADDQLDSQSLLGYMQAKMLGAPISLESIHRVMQDRDLTQLTYEEELIAIENEVALTTPPGTDAGGDGE